MEGWDLSMALIVLHVSQGGRSGLGELWEALLGTSLWDSGLLPFLWSSMPLQSYLLLGSALPKILVLLVSAMLRVQSQKDVRMGGLSGRHRPGLEAQAPSAAGMGGGFVCGHRNVLCPLGI